MQLASVALLLTTLPLAQAELAAPNGAGVAMGHVHLNVKNIDASRQFFVNLGGTAVKNGALEMIEFPGMYFVLRSQEPSGPTTDSTVNHVGFLVKDVLASVAKWKSLGLRVEPGLGPTNFNVFTPEGAKIEIIEDKTLATPMRFHHIHYFLPDPIAAQTWYAKMFGAAPGKRGPYDAADIPGVNLTFQKVDTMQTAIKGRAIDHIGFEVKDLAAICSKVEAEGVPVDRRNSSSPTLKIAYLTDPWGTYIELTQGLPPLR